MYKHNITAAFAWTVLGTLVIGASIVQLRFILNVLSPSQSPSVDTPTGSITTAKPATVASPPQISQDEPIGFEFNWGGIGKAFLALLVAATTGYLVWRFIVNPWGWRLTTRQYKVEVKKLKILEQTLDTGLVDSGLITLKKKNAHLSLSWKTRWNKEIVLDALMVMAATISDADMFISATRGVTTRDPRTGKRVCLTAETLQGRLVDRLEHLCVEQDVITTITAPTPKNTKVDQTRYLKSLPVDEVYGPLAQVLALTQGTPYDTVLDTSVPELRLTLQAGTTMAGARHYTQIIDASAELGLNINRTKQLGSLTYLTALLPSTSGLPEPPSRSAAVAPLSEAIELDATITGDEAAQLGLELPSPDPTSQAVTWFTPTRSYD